MDKKYIVDEALRLDKFLAKNIDVSRNQIEHFIKDGNVLVDGKKVSKTGLKLKIDQEITLLEIEEEKSETHFDDLTLEALDIKIIHEDDNFLVVFKPIGLTVHPAPSVKEATLVDWLKYKNIRLSTLSGEERHGIVHRLDKGTSGLLVVAKTNEAHAKLSAQLEDKSMGRYYLALIDIPLKEDCVVDKPIARNPNNRLKMGIVPSGKQAKTAFKKIASTIESSPKQYELIAAKLFTGRTHQIRVHLESIGRHILGDDLYGFKSKGDKINRIFLHAYCLYLKDPISNEELNFLSPLPDDFKKALDKNFEKEELNEKVNPKYIVDCFNDLSNWM